MSLNFRNRQKLADDLEAKRRKQWKLNKTQAVNRSSVSYKKIIDISEPPVELNEAKTPPKELRHLALKPKPIKSRLVAARRLETRSLAPKDFDLIGTGRPGGRIDSAGNRLDMRHAIRQLQRQKMVLALESGELPLGSYNAQHLSQRIESQIFKVLKNYLNEYKLQCSHFGDWINDPENRQLKNDLMLGRLNPADLAFLPQPDQQLSEIIAMRIRWQELETNWKLVQLKQNAKKTKR